MIKKFNFFLKKYIYILPIKNIILFPGLILPLIISKSKNINLIKKIYKKNKTIGIITKKNKYKIYNIGTIGYIIKIFSMPNNNLTVILQGKIRFKIIKLFFFKKFFFSKIKILNYFFLKKKYFFFILELIKSLSKKIINNNFISFLNKKFNFKKINNIIFLIYYVTININISIKKKQIILIQNNIIKKSLILLKYLNIEYKKIKIKNLIQIKIKKKIILQQKKYFLEQQIKILQKELNKKNYNNEINNLKKKSFKKKWSNEANKKFNIEISKLEFINRQQYEYNIIKNYLIFLLDLPWYKYSNDNFNFKRAIKILNKNHYGLEKVKNRILEYLSVLKFKKKKYIKSPILCFLGPPGVGKTSLGKSISKVLCRKYVRISLGGIHDESIIRGHRKTYIGAMPGRILQLIKKAGTSNPIFILDEIDKLNISNNGDPSSAMLEVLDPEQNKYFYDNYLEINYDLSKIFFIATANNINNINNALLDRMEIININGYSIEEKVKIVNKILLPKILKNNKLKKKNFILKKKNIKKIIINYTYESGIRNLERCISKLVNFIIKNIVIYKKYIKNINSNIIEKVLGYKNNLIKYKKIKLPGISIGLAWTNFGGDIIYIESVLLKSNIKNNGGNLSITGNIGKIMKESAILAFNYIKANYKLLKINFNLLQKYNIHLHIPEGSIPKDGPSAGISILISFISLFKKKKIKSFLAMTGEITLKGKVLEVGGIKEKILAAKRSSIKRIILPYNNKKNLLNIKKKNLLGLKFNFVKKIEEVIKLSF